MSKDKNVVDSTGESESDMGNDYEIFKKSVSGELQRLSRALERMTVSMESLKVSQASTSTRMAHRILNPDRPQVRKPQVRGEVDDTEDIVGQGRGRGEVHGGNRTGVGWNRGGDARLGRNDDDTETYQTNTIDGDLSSIKMKVPEFKGNNNAEEYIEWERKTEQIFECHNYTEEKKSHIAAVEFTGYASFWWDQLKSTRRNKGLRAVPPWDYLKELMRQRFIPSHYYRDLYNRLARLVQGGKSVEEYHKEMEMMMARAHIEEDEQMLMSRFLGGLNHYIAEELDMYQYNTMEDMVDKAMKI